MDWLKVAGELQRLFRQAANASRLLDRDL